MKRLISIALELKVGVRTLMYYCERFGLTDVTPHGKIDLQLEKKIKAVHNGEISLPEIKEKEDTLVLSTSDLPEAFSQENPYREEEKSIIAEGDRFSHRDERLIIPGASELKTIFSDFEVYSICSGLDNRHAKHLARNYFSNKEVSDINLIEAHSIAMATYSKYGGKALTYIISLPPLPFKAINATQIFSELDKRRKKQDYPILRITFQNDKNQTEKIQISYFAEKTEYGRKRNDNVLLVRNNSTGQTLMRVSRDGVVVPEKNATHIVPVLQVFLRFSKDAKKAILNYGLETGECSICGRELTDPESIRIGIGPVCREYL